MIKQINRFSISTRIWIVLVHVVQHDLMLYSILCLSQGVFCSILDHRLTTTVKFLLNQFLFLMPSFCDLFS